jgi:hypothetical protein
MASTAVRELLTSSTSEDWHSPSEYVEPARYTLGGHIDRDPASCPLANTIVKAAHIWTINDDGLFQPWDVPVEDGEPGTRRAATVFHNPPSSTDNGDIVADWWIKAMREIAAGRVSALVFFAFRAAAIASMAYQSVKEGVPGPHTAWRCEVGRVKFLRPRVVGAETGEVVPAQIRGKAGRRGDRSTVFLPGFEPPKVIVPGGTLDGGETHERGDQPMHDSALLCLGSDDVIARFREAFAPLGHVMPPEWKS